MLENQRICVSWRIFLKNRRQFNCSGKETHEQLSLNNKTQLWIIQVTHSIKNQVYVNFWTVIFINSTIIFSCGLTLDKVVVGLAPGVTVVGGQDANRLFIGLKGRVPDLLQLNIYLIYSQWCTIAVVHIQNKELRNTERIRYLHIHLSSFYFTAYCSNVTGKYQSNPKLEYIHLFIFKSRCGHKTAWNAALCCKLAFLILYSYINGLS